MELRWGEAILFVFCIVLLGLSIVHFLEADALREENAALALELQETGAALDAAEETIAYQGNRIDGLGLELGQASKELEGARADIRALSAGLNETEGRVGELEEEFTEFREEYIELQGQYQEKAEEYEALLGELDEFEEDLQQKMYWYTENADFGGETKGFLSRFETKCIDGNTLNMPCVAFVLEQRGFEYIGEGKDHIKSLEEFEQDDGGDCEDWSVFIKAVINELAEQEGVEELLLVDFGEEGYFEVHQDEGIVYYYSNGGVTVDVEDLSVACYPVTAWQGHCALVSGGVLFEPQDGPYIADVYWEGEDYLIDEGGYLEVLIDDEDIHVQSGETWISYAYFIERLRELKE